MRIRIVPNASGKHAVQVVSKRYGNVTVHKHIGTLSALEARSRLVIKAEKFIKVQTGQSDFLTLSPRSLKYPKSGTVNKFQLFFS